MHKNVLGHDIRWLWVMRKLNTPLSVSSYAIGTAKSKEIFEYPMPLSATWYDFGDIYFDEEEIVEIKKFLRYKFEKDRAYPSVIARQIYKLADEIKSHKPLKEEVTGKTIAELLDLFKKERETFITMIGFMSYRGSVQMGDVLEEEIKDILSYRLAALNKLPLSEKYLETLSVSLHESVIVEERVALLNLSIGFNALSAEDKQARIRQYLDEFEWLSYHWFVGTSPTVLVVQQKILAHAATAQEEVERVTEEKERQERDIETAMTELGLDADEKEVVRQFRAAIFLRTYVKDHINLAAYRLLPILYAIGDQLGIEGPHMPFLTLEEIDSIEKYSATELREKIQSRLNGFSAGLMDGKNTSEGFARPVQASKSTDDTQIKGSPAYRGIVQGRVKVILSPKEQDKLNPGEILVTSMTTPDFLPSMQRAAAFVTDEGGITCHAAIIAREMKKPCVIGTKNATKILKDNDLVEVDAQTGVVSKIAT